MVAIEYNTESIDPRKAKAATFHHQDLKNDSPGTLKTTVR